MTAETVREAGVHTPVHQDSYASVYHGDCLDVMRDFADESFDSVVTDPPYGLTKIDQTKTRKALEAWSRGDDSFVPGGRGFMNKEWDQFVPPPAVWRETFRLLKPGGYLVCFAGSRTVDLMALSIRCGGFEVEGTGEWAYGSGMPKSMNIGRAIDRRSGFKGEVIGQEQVDVGMQGGQLYTGRPSRIVTRDVHALSKQAEPWQGWGTALKPAREPYIIARKPDTDAPPARIPRLIYAAKAGRGERPIVIDEDGSTLAHSTVKPCGIIGTLISAVTPAGGRTLDPFLGSGTACEAATRAARRSVGIELDATHIPLVVERLTGRDIWAGGLLD